MTMEARLVGIRFGKNLRPKPYMFDFEAYPVLISETFTSYFPQYVLFESHFCVILFDRVLVNMSKIKLIVFKLTGHGVECIENV